MAKELHCGELMPGCDKVIEGDNEAEVLEKAAEHARQDHGVPSIPPEMSSKVKAAIREAEQLHPRRRNGRALCELAWRERPRRRLLLA